MGESRLGICISWVRRCRRRRGGRTLLGVDGVARIKATVVLRQSERLCNCAKVMSKMTLVALAEI